MTAAKLRQHGTSSENLALIAAIASATLGKRRRRLRAAQHQRTGFLREFHAIVILAGTADLDEHAALGRGLCVRGRQRDERNVGALHGGGSPS